MVKPKFIGILVAFILLVNQACILSAAPTQAGPQAASGVSTEPALETATATDLATATDAPTATAAPVAVATPTSALLTLEVVQSQVWTDPDGHIRVNVLLRNPADFPVQPDFGDGANLLDASGKFIRSEKLYFLDGISGGTGYILPGETIAANACFACESAPLTDQWSSVGFFTGIDQASVSWTTSTEVEATISGVSFSGDNPIFGVTGTVKNKSSAVLSRIAARVFVFDQKGNLVGTAAVSADNVGPGASASVNGYGIGKAPAGPVTYKVSALGVKY